MLPITVKASQGVTFRVYDPTDPHQQSIVVVDADHDTALFSGDELRALLDAVPTLRSSSGIVARLQDQTRAEVLDELDEELRTWRENNVAFRQRHVDGTDAESSLASALMADERRVAIDKVLVMVAKLRAGRPIRPGLR